MAGVVLALFILVGAIEAESACDVRSFGAKGDGVSYDTQAIQQAIDFCAAQAFTQQKQRQELKEEAEAVAVAETQQRHRANSSTSIVTFPAPGLYLTGTLFLRSGTLLHISRGATLLASSLQDHYPTLSSRWYLLLAENVSDVGITGSDISMVGSDISTIGSDDSLGEYGAGSYDAAARADVTTFNGKNPGSRAGILGSGIIDGQSSLFVQSFNSIKNVMVSWNQTGACVGNQCRPRLIGFLDCQRVKIWNIQLHQPASWCIHLVRSDGISIHDVSIVGDFNTPNNDGIDIDSSNNTIIHNCHIDTGDDGICPKTNYGPIHNLTVYGCSIRTKSCAVKLGSESSHDFVGLYFNDVQIVESHRGIGLQLRDSGNIYDVVFSNFYITTRFYDASWWGQAEPIYVTSCPRTFDTMVGSITNVSFVNITAVSENGIFLSGLGGGMLRDVRLETVNVYLSRVTNYTDDVADYRPGCQGLVKRQKSDFFAENVSSLILNSVHVQSVDFIHGLLSGTTAEKMQFANFSLSLENPLHSSTVG